MPESAIGAGGISVVPGSTQTVYPQWFGMYYATVSNNADPLGLGRCQLNIPQVLGTEVSTWAWALTTPTATGGTAGSATTAAATAAVAVTPPPVGTVVAAMFLGGDLSNPAYLLVTTSATTVTTPIATTTASTGTTGSTGTAAGGTSSGGATITTTSLPAADSGVAYSQTLAASGGTGAGYTWAVTTGSLPAGLTLSSAGVISGNVTGTGTSTFTVGVTDSGGNTASQSLSITASSATPTGSPAGGPWTLVFADEFDVAYPTPYGTGPNPNVWSDRMLNGDLYRSNDDGEEQWYPHGYYAHSVANSILTLTAQWQNPSGIDPTAGTGGSDLGPYTATSGMIASFTSFNFTYGYVEIYMQHPATNVSQWAQFAMYTRDNVWPPEIDIDEYNPPGYSDETHNGYYSTNETQYSNYFSTDGNYHTWGVSVTPEYVTYYYDGTQTYQCPYDGHPYAWFPIYTLAVRPGASSSGYPYSVNIDYIRAWVMEGVPAAPAVTSISPSTGIASGGDIVVDFSTVAGATSYRVTASPTDALADGYGGSSATGTTRFTASGTASPLTITGLPSGVRWNVTCCAINSVGYSQESAPAGPQIIDIQLTTTSLPPATIGTAYSATLAAQAGVTPYTWSISAGSLPTGLSLGSSTGIISGTPTAIGAGTFTVKVTGASGWTGAGTVANSASQVLSITTPSSGGGGATITTPTGTWTEVASEDFSTNTLATNFVVYDGGQATSYTADSWMASQVSINTTTKELLSLAELTGGPGSSRVGGAYYWTGGSSSPAIMQYGAWEIDFYNQGQAGYAPVLLMWPIPDDGNWPIDGEIDIVELGVTTSSTVTFTGGSINIHLDTTAGSSRALHLSFPSTTNWTVQHTVRMEWMPSYISIFLDGTQVATTTDTSYIPHTKPMRLTLQQEFYGVSDSSISALSAYSIVTGLRAYSSSSSIAG